MFLPKWFQKIWIPTAINIQSILPLTYIVTIKNKNLATDFNNQNKEIVIDDQNDYQFPTIANQ